MSHGFVFQVHIKGPGSDPEGIGTGELAEIIRHLENAISAMAGEDTKPVGTIEEPILRLVHIEKIKDKS